MHFFCVSTFLLFCFSFPCVFTLFSPHSLLYLLTPLQSFFCSQFLLFSCFVKPPFCLYQLLTSLLSSRLLILTVYSTRLPLFALLGSLFYSLADFFLPSLCSISTLISRPSYSLLLYNSLNCCLLSSLSLFSLTAHYSLAAPFSSLLP